MRWSQPLVDGFPDLRYEEATMISGRVCNVGQDYVVIDQRGQVAKCHMTIGETLGDVADDDPLRLVRSDRRSVQNLLVEEKEGCRECTWRHWCSGGCPVATFRATGRPAHS